MDIPKQLAFNSLRDAWVRQACMSGYVKRGRACAREDYGLSDLQLTFGASLLLTDD